MPHSKTMSKINGPLLPGYTVIGGNGSPAFVPCMMFFRQRRRLWPRSRGWNRKDEVRPRYRFIFAQVSYRARRRAGSSREIPYAVITMTLTGFSGTAPKPTITGCP